MHNPIPENSRCGEKYIEREKNGEGWGREEGRKRKERRKKKLERVRRRPMWRPLHVTKQ
jgi:hypothetical protein